MSDLEARKLLFSRGNLGNGLANVFADCLADICNGVIVIKLGQGLSIFKRLHIVQCGCSIATEPKLPGKPGDDVLPGVRVWCHHPRQGRGLSHQKGVVPLPLLVKSQMGWMN
jgi:hypothetical protein